MSFRDFATGTVPAMVGGFGVGIGIGGVICGWRMWAVEGWI